MKGTEYLRAKGNMEVNSIPRKIIIKIFYFLFCIFRQVPTRVS